jgi:hypothetical protein
MASAFLVSGCVELISQRVEDFSDFREFEFERGCRGHIPVNSAAAATINRVGPGHYTIRMSIVESTDPPGYDCWVLEELPERSLEDWEERRMLDLFSSMPVQYRFWNFFTGYPSRLLYATWDGFTVGAVLNEGSVAGPYDPIPFFEPDTWDEILELLDSFRTAP